MLKFFFSIFFGLLVYSSPAYSQASVVIDSLLRELAGVETPSQKSILHNAVAYQAHTSDSSIALKHAHQALSLASLGKNKKEKAEAYKNIGLTYGYFGQNERAITYYDSAYSIFHSLRDTNKMVGILNNVGRQYCNVGQYENAIHGYLQAEQWASLEQDSTLWLILKFNHAACLMESSQFQKSISLCDEILPFAKAINHWYLQVELYSLQGVSYMELKNYEAAENSFGKAFDCIPRSSLPTVGSTYVSSNPDLESNILNNQALLYIEQEQFEKAYVDLKLAVEILENVKAVHPNGEFYVNLGIAAKGMGLWTESIEYFKEGLHRLEQANQTPLIGETYGYMAELYSISGNEILAYEYLKKSYNIKDSLLSEKTQQHLQELNIKYETAKFRNELADTQFQIQRQRYHFNLFVIGVASVFLLGIIAYFFYHNRQQQKLLALEKRQIELQYGLLRAQMNPHFIFNALNSIHGFFTNGQYVRGNEFMGKFSRLIRQVLDQSTLTVHPLSEELDTLRLYLDIEKERLGEQLEYSIQLGNEVEEDIIELPPLIFQPFVENAIWHGIAPKDSTGHISIAIKLNEMQNRLLCQIKDDGVGLESNVYLQTTSPTSKGIKITQERLSGVGNIKIKNNKDQMGVTVDIDILIG